jgi:NAD+ synthase (glutamine-hydrolysing)
MASVRVGLAQINPVVGDLGGNLERILAAMAEAERSGCEVLALAELAVTGYPPEDLLLRRSFVAHNLEILDAVVAASGSCVTVVGFVDVDRGGRTGPVPEGTEELPARYNAAAVCTEGRLAGVYRKRRLPNYSVFDEQRYFVPGSDPLVLHDIGGRTVGVSICEDAWVADGPVAELGRGGADLVVNINASPFHLGKRVAREQTLAARAVEAGVPIVYVNQVGGQDELVFDGDSMVVGPDGSVVARAPQFREALLVVDVDLGTAARDRRLPVVDARPTRRAPSDPVHAPRPGVVAPPLSPDAELWEALVLGTRDFVVKNGFSDVVIGLSGGIDSALVATIAVDALGADRVHGVLMPSRYSSEHSVADAVALAEHLGIEHRVVPIEPAHVALMGMLEPSFVDHPLGLTEENLQSRVRAVVLMGFSNAFGWLLLNTGNKSEAAVGYSTLYGDSAGGFAVIKDVGKLAVYRLCRYRNAAAGRDLIPASTIEKPPSAELRPDQRDDQSLPAYEVLDPILAAYVEQDRSPDEIIAAGGDPALVDQVVRLVDRAEFKRRQSPPGPRVTTKGFGKDRRLPITNRYEG